MNDLKAFADIVQTFRSKAQAAALMAGSTEGSTGLFRDAERERRVAVYAAEARAWAEAADILEAAITLGFAARRG